MIDVGDSRELQAATLAMKRLPREIRTEISKRTRDTMNPVWKSLVQTNATGRFESRLLNSGTRIAAGNPPRALAAQSRATVGGAKRKRSGGGLVPSQHYYLAEFGGRSNETSTYTRKSKNGGTHKVTRRTRTGLPVRTPSGRAVYPAFAEIGPRLSSLWVQTLIRTTYDAIEGK